MFFLEDLLTEALKLEKARKWILQKIFVNFDFGLTFVQDLYDFLLKIPPKQLCYHLVAGLTVKETKINDQGTHGICLFIG